MALVQAHRDCVPAARYEPENLDIYRSPRFLKKKKKLLYKNFTAIMAT